MSGPPVVSQNFGIGKKERRSKNGHASCVVWMTGLPCSGKTTLARRLQQELFEAGHQVYVLDGDNLRQGLNRDLDFSAEGRRENLRRVAEVAKLFVDAGFIVIAAFISPYRRSRREARGLFERGEFIEVYIKTSLALCEQRDVKGMYKKARQNILKDFTGVSSPYEEPADPEVTVDTGSLDVAAGAAKVVEYLKRQKCIGGA